MQVRKRAIAIMFLGALSLGAMGTSAVAAPMPWETSRIPAVPPVTAAPSGTVTVECSGSCYE
jgi:hypothetical protein